MPWKKKKKRIIAQIIAPKIFDQLQNLYEHTPFLFQFLFEFIKDIHIYHQFLELFRSSRIIFLNILLIAVAVLAVINVNISRSLLHLRDTKTTTSLSNMGYIRTIFPDKNVNGYNF